MQKQEKKPRFYFEDKGDPNCEQRLRFEKYIKSFFEKGAQIATDINCYKILIDERADNLFILSSSFFELSIYNAFAMATIQLTAFFSKKDSASIYKFLNYCEHNQKYIFTKEFFENKKGVSAKIDLGDFPSRLKEARALLEKNEGLIKRIKRNRDIAFAHFDKRFLITGKETLTIEANELVEAYYLAEKIINIINVFYDRIEIHFSPINALDIIQTIEIVNDYVRRKEAEDSIE